VKVFVANDGPSVLGVYTTKERAQARCEEWVPSDGVKRPWQRYDGAWQMYAKWEGEQMILRVTECEVET
jgi:hypothetical protein